MHPDDSGGGVDGFPHASEKVFAAFEPEPGLLMTRRYEAYGPYIEKQTEIIEPHR